jgi:ADP-heptose:LPS heptosyltransferase
MRILAVRIGRVGDTVMMVPALKAILHCYPHAQITILASPDGKRLLDDFHPPVEQIWIWDRHDLIKSCLDKRRLVKKMSSSKFDRIFCFDQSKRIARLFIKSTAELCWLQRVTEPKHSSRHYLDLVAKSCDFQADKFFNYLPVSNAESEQIERELSTVGIMPDDIVVMIHPTYSGFSRLGIRKRKARARKLWPASNYGTLGKLLSTQTIAGRQLKPLIDLIPGERPFGQQIVRRTDNAITLLDPKPGLSRYKALIKRADIRHIHH